MNENNENLLNQLKSLNNEISNNNVVHKSTIDLLYKYQGNKISLDKLDLLECKELEKKLKISLENVEVRKVRDCRFLIVRNQIIDIACSYFLPVIITIVIFVLLLSLLL